MSDDQIPADSAWQPADGPAPVHDNRVVPDHQMQAVDAVLSWLDRWAQHVGRCAGGERCICGLTCVRHELDIAFHPENWVLGDGK